MKRSQRLPDGANGTSDIFVRGAPLAATQTTTYTYDAADRPTEACPDAACTSDFARYGYDPVGNRFSQQTPLDTTTYS